MNKDYLVLDLKYQWGEQSAILLYFLLFYRIILCIALSLVILTVVLEFYN